MMMNDVMDNIMGAVLNDGMGGCDESRAG